MLRAYGPQGRRGFAAFTRGTMLASHPGAPAMVGALVSRTADLMIMPQPLPTGAADTRPDAE